MTLPNPRQLPRQTTIDDTPPSSLSRHRWFAATFWPGGVLLGLLVTGLAREAPADSPAEETRLGSIEYAAGRFAPALLHWLRAAATGDADAAFALGVAYDLGKGVAADAPTACRWYEKAARAGQVTAMFNLGVMNDAGGCGVRRADLAATWYARAAAFGHARAQYDLAQLYADGDGVPRNPDQSAAWFRRAEAAGLTAAAGRASVRQPDLDRPTQLSPPAPIDPGIIRPSPASDGKVKLALVWIAPAQPRPVRFFVEIDTDGVTPHEVFAGYAEVSALQVALPPGQVYAWRVMTVSFDPPDYTAGPWQRFSIAGPAQP